MTDPQNLANSRALFNRAKTVFPGGVARQTVAGKPTPIYMDHGSGAWIEDVDGNRYLDFNNNFTTLIHGHAFAPVVEAVTRQLTRGSCFANPTEPEIELATLICERTPAVEQLRFVNTGSEAVAFAIKAARAHTGRSKVAKFEGAYHGAYDWAEVSEDSGPHNWGPPSAPASVPYYAGCPDSVLEETVVLPINAADESLAILEANAGNLACVLIDVMPSRCGLIAASADYLTMLSDFCRQHGILIISDEVLNFRQSYAGASARFGLMPDLITLGKIIGGGLPIGAIGGKREVMAVFDGSKDRPAVSQGGTFSANPLSMAAGIASLTALDKAAIDRLDRLCQRALTQIGDLFTDRELPLSISGQASLFRIHGKSELPRSYRETLLNETEQCQFNHLITGLRHRGINLPTHGTGALSTPMTEQDIDFFVRAVEEVIRDWRHEPGGVNQSHSF